MRIIVHPPTVSAPDGTEQVAAVVLGAVHDAVRGVDAESAPTADAATAEEPVVPAEE